MKKLLSGIILLIVLGAAGWWYWRQRDQETTRYQTATVTRGELTQLVTATGQLNPVVNVQVGSQISGTIAKLYADYNSQVTNGQVIAELDASTYRALVTQAEGELASARAGLELAQVNARRSKELLDSKLLPQSDYDKAVADLHQAEATVLIRSGALERARVDLARCTIYSPVDGIVISRSVDVGQTVAASFSAPVLFQIANDLSKMQIDANVAEADIGQITVGQSVNFTVDAFPNQTFQGEVIQVRNAPLDVQNVISYDTVISVHNPDLILKPGMTANVSIIIAHRESVLKLPNAALRYRPPDAEPDKRHVRHVYKLDAKNEPQPVEVKLGLSDGIFTEVTSGLQDGDAVITGAVAARKGRAGSNNPFGGGRRRF